jgi:hypothetical protein
VQHYQETVRDEVLDAERAVLYTIGFNLNIVLPYRFLFHFQKMQWVEKDIFTAAWIFINDRWGWPCQGVCMYKVVVLIKDADELHPSYCEMVTCHVSVMELSLRKLADCCGDNGIGKDLPGGGDYALEHKYSSGKLACIGRDFFRTAFFHIACFR